MFNFGLFVSPGLYDIPPPGSKWEFEKWWSDAKIDHEYFGLSQSGEGFIFGFVSHTDRKTAAAIFLENLNEN